LKPVLVLQVPKSGPRWHALMLDVFRRLPQLRDASWLKLHGLPAPRAERITDMPPPGGVDFAMA